MAVPRTSNALFVICTVVSLLSLAPLALDVGRDYDGQKISWRQSRGCANCTASPKYLCGRVQSVHDGDTFRIVPTFGQRSVPVRLLQLDAPELRQAHGQEARDALAQLLLAPGSRVCVVSPGRDRYRRLLGFVCLRQGRRQLDVNAWLLASGHAWCYRNHCCPAYAAAVKAARAAGRGLWSTATGQKATPGTPLEPWIFRRRQRRQHWHHRRRGHEKHGDGHRLLS